MPRIEITPSTHPEFFSLLAQVERAPTQLWIESERSISHWTENLPEKGLAIVGTREPTTKSAQLIKDSLGQLSTLSQLSIKNSVPNIIVSGFARGIDYLAHTAAVDCGLETIAILGAGLDTEYPAHYRTLKRQILGSGGALITEFSSHTKTAGWHFILRNRLIAALAKATWVVEAPSRSGALNTAHWAFGLDRDVYATPQFPGGVYLMGCQKLLSQTQARAFWDLESLGETWLSLSTANQLTRPKAGLSGDQNAYLPQLKLLTPLEKEFLKHLLETLDTTQNVHFEDLIDLGDRIKIPHPQWIRIVQDLRAQGLVDLKKDRYFLNSAKCQEIGVLLGKNRENQLNG